MQQKSLVVCLLLAGMMCSTPSWAESPERRGLLDDIGNVIDDGLNDLGNAIDDVGQSISQWWNGFDPLDAATWPDDLGSIDNHLFTDFDSGSVTQFFNNTGERLGELSSDLFSQVSWEQFSGMGQHALNQLQPKQFFALPDSILEQLNTRQIAALAEGVWQQIDAVNFKRLPQHLYQALDADRFAQLPAEVFADFTAEELATFAADSFRGLTGEQFVQLRDEALGHLNTAQLAQLPASVLSQMGFEELQTLDKKAWWGMAQQAPGRFSDWLTQLDSTRLSPEQLSEYLPQGLEIDPLTGEFILVPENFLLSYPRLQFAANLLPNSVRYQPPYDLSQGFGLGGGGADALGHLQSIVNGQITGFDVQQTAEGVLELAGPGGFSLPFWVLDAQVRKVSDDVPSGIGVDVSTGAFSLTSENGIQFNLVYAPPSILNLAHLFGVGIDTDDPGRLEINQHGVVCTVPPRHQHTDANAWYPPYRMNAYTAALQDAEGGGQVTRLPGTPEGFNQRLQIQYDNGSEQIAYPTVPDPTAFSQALQVLGLPAHFITYQADGGFNVLIPQADGHLRPLRVWFSHTAEMLDVAPGDNISSEFDFSDLNNMAFITALDCADNKQLRLPFQIEWLDE